MGVKNKSFWAIPTASHSVFKIIIPEPILRMDVRNIWKGDNRNIRLKTNTIISVTIEVEIKMVRAVSPSHIT
jgi:hypothetical protein